MVVVVIAFALSFIGNVILHESGHYVVARMYGLNPSMEFGSIEGAFGFGSGAGAVASTVFDNTKDKLVIFVIAIAGPLLNLFVGLILLIMYVYAEDSSVKIIVFSIMVPAFVSFFMNALPFSGSDGSIILSLF